MWSGTIEQSSGAGGSARVLKRPRRSPGKHPPWLVVRLGASCAHTGVGDVLRELHLNTVCRSARCPNASECFGAGTATFMILGAACTRNCSFCAVGTGTPEPVDAGEPERVAEAVRQLALAHAVITSVTRDDLDDGGAGQFARTILAIKGRTDATIEVLVPDFSGDAAAVRTVLDAGPDVFNHNIETVQRLYRAVRPQADYDRSLALLRTARDIDAGVLTKSGLMVGLSETREELRRTFRNLAAAGVDMLTIGQYLSPTPDHFPIHRYVHPEDFKNLEDDARAAGIAEVAAGPLVRSSYHAREAFQRLRAARQSCENTSMVHHKEKR